MSDKPTGVWFTDKSWMGHKGAVIVLEMIHAHDKSDNPIPSYVTSRCPACQSEQFTNRKVLRWMILPP
jgi:hypothetical protein